MLINPYVFSKDPYYNNVGLLLHMDGANNSTTIVDNSPRAKTVTAVGNAKLSTAAIKYGSASLLLDGNGDYLGFGQDTDFAFGTSDFTIEAWIYIAANSALDNDSQRPAAVFSCYPGSGSLTGVVAYAFAISGNNTTTGTGLSFANRQNNTTYSVNGVSSITQNTWHHIAVSRSGVTTRLFLNGNNIGSGVLGNQTISYQNNFRIGGLGYSGYLQELNGRIDDLRVTKGVARYTANFTPPTAPFPDS